MLHSPRLFLSLLLALPFLSAAGASTTAWEGAFEHRLDAKSTKLSNGRPVVRLRCRAKAGEVVWATLRGAAKDDKNAPPLRAIVLEYDPSGGRGEWEPANEGNDGSLGFEIRAPANGVVEFRVRGQNPDTTESFSLDYGADTAGAKPTFSTAGDIKSSIDAGYHKLYPLNVPRGNSPFEFELWAEGFEPTMSLTDPKGNDVGFVALDRGPTFLARRYVAPFEGRHQFKVRSTDSRGGSFLLRIWYPIPVTSRK